MLNKSLALFNKLNHQQEKDFVEKLLDNLETGEVEELNLAMTVEIIGEPVIKVKPRYTTPKPPKKRVYSADSEEEKQVKPSRSHGPPSKLIASENKTEGNWPQPLPESIKRLRQLPYQWAYQVKDGWVNYDFDLNWNIEQFYLTLQMKKDAVLNYTMGAQGSKR